MTTIQDVLAAIEAERDQATAAVRDILGRAEAEGRSQLTPAESQRAEAALAARRAIGGRLTEARQAAAEQAAYDRLAAEHYDTGVRSPGAGGPTDRARTASFQVGRNERTYRPDTDPKGRGFMLDVARSFLFHDPAAVDRIAQHQREEELERPGWQERANASTGNFAGAVVPQYLVDMWAPLARAMRPFADVCTHHDLPPEGMTVNIPSLSTGTTTAIQSSENSAGSSTAPNDTLVTENVQTITGNVTISRQAVERGYGVDDFIGQDLMNSLATTLDNTLINQATTGLAALAVSTTYTDASPTVAALWPFLFQIGSQVEKSYLQVAQWSHLVMGISRWNWLTSALSSTFPFAGTAIQSTPEYQGAVSVTGEYGPAVRGRLSNGKLICVDGNVPTNLGGGTNQDEIYAVPASECHLWEDPSAPVMLRAEQPAAASLGILLVAYEYMAYSFRRVNGAVPHKVGGGVSTGMIVPAGF